MRPAQGRLTDSQITAFQNQGFLAIDSVVPLDDLRHTQALLDGLFDRFDTLPKTIALDIAADGTTQSTAPSIPEINSAVRLAPELLQTAAFRNCREIARQLIGPDVSFAGDHAIYKPPRNQKETPWHQDQAYLGHPFVGRTVSFWLPLQTVTLDMGCMKFVPGSHKRGVLPHHRKDHNPKAHALMTDHVDLTKVVACPLEAGGVTIHSPLTLHATGPNESDTPRRAWIFAFTANSRYGVVRAATVTMNVVRRVRAKIAQ